jgi:hypothetical protein
MTTWKRAAGVLLLTGMTLAAGTSPAGIRAFWSTRQFFCYFQELTRSSRPAGFWDRVELSLVLTTTAPRPVCQRTCPRPASL